MTDAQAALAQVREAMAAGPTPGEWRYIVDDGDRKLTAAGASGAFMRDTTYYPWCPDNEGDWKLMAACSPANMTAILAHVEAQAAEIERLTAALRAQPGAVNMDDVEWAGKVHLQDAQQEIERLHAVAQHEADCAEAYRAQVEMMIRERDELRRQLAEAELDAQRYRDWLRGGANIPPESTRWARWEVRHWDGRHWNTLFAEALDTSIDAAMGGNDV